MLLSGTNMPIQPATFTAQMKIHQAKRRSEKGRERLGGLQEGEDREG